MSLEYVDGSPKSPEKMQAWQQRWKKTWYDRSGQVECTEWRFERSEAWTFVAVNKEKRKGQYEKLVSLQHNEFRLWYESFEDTDPPTYELSGAHSSDGLGPSSHMFNLDNSWEPPKSILRKGIHKYATGPVLDFISRLTGLGSVTERAPAETNGHTVVGGKIRWLEEAKIFYEAAVQGLFPEFTGGDWKVVDKKTKEGKFRPVANVVQSQLLYGFTSVGLKKTMKFAEIAQHLNKSV